MSKLVDHRTVNDLPPVMTVPEAARFLRVGVSTLWQAVWDKEIHSIRVRNTVRIPRHEIGRLLGLNEEEVAAR